MELQLSNTQKQTPVLTQNQIQFLNMLTMTNQELDQWLLQQFMENPFIEKKMIDNKSLADTSLYQNRGFSSSQKDNITYKEPVFFEGKELFHFLTEQLRYSDYSKQDWALITYLIYNLDEKGFFTLDLNHAANETGFHKEELESFLHTLQELEPYGIFSSGIAECYMKQLEKKNFSDPILFDILSNNLEDLLYKKMSRLYKKYKISSEQVNTYHQILSELHPYPLMHFQSGEIHHLTPDIICIMENRILVPTLNDSSTGNYSISDYYLSMMQQTKEPELKEYLSKKYTTASNIIKNIESRKNTLLQITKAVIEKQSLFFYHKGHLLPLSMSQIADICELSTSTVSRAIHDKYLQYPGGIILMKELFPSSSEIGERSEFALSPEQVKETILQIIKMENPKKPLSDDEIASTLKCEGIPISRRTVAKYRTEMFIPTSRERKER